MSDTEKNPKTMMFLNMDFRMTTLIYFFCLCICKILIFLFIYFCKIVQMLSYKFKHVSSLIMAVFSQLIKETIISCLCLYMNLA